MPLAGELRKPEELCGPAMTDRTVVESLLFDAFIPAAYRNDLAGQWEAQDVEKWLVFLARHLERRIASPDLAWWQLRRAVPPRTFELAAWFGVALLAGLCSVLVIGLTPATGHGFVNGLRNGLLGGLGIAVVVAFMPVFGAYLPWSLFWPRKRNTKAASRSIRTGAGAPSRGIRMNAKGLVAGLVFGLAFGLLTGLAAEFAGRAAGGLGTGLGSVLTVGYVVGLVRGLAAAPGDLAAAASPREVLARDQRAAVLLTLTVGLGFGLIVGLVAGLRVGLTAGVGVGLAAGLVAGLLASMIQTAWPSYMLATRWLAFRRHLPRSLMSFLADAHQRGVLRQAGAVYQFRHIELEHRLASAPGKIGSCFDVRDVDGNQARVTLVKVIDPARGADQYTTPDNAKRFVGAVIKIEALSGKGNAHAALIGSNRETYAADVAWYANFRMGRFRVLGETVTRAVTFQVPDGVKVEEVQLTAGNGFSSTARWDVRS
jgi:hypothetical protein